MKPDKILLERNYSEGICKKWSPFLGRKVVSFQDSNYLWPTFKKQFLINCVKNKEFLRIGQEVFRANKKIGYAVIAVLK